MPATLSVMVMSVMVLMLVVLLFAIVFVRGLMMIHTVLQNVLF
ncbi:hypothetical protein CKA32_002293 [Geitlerinema sp. FC II]|nr:hypothetical protein CKA32_002293 [Geitlerinema sp. FC II]